MRRATMNRALLSVVLGMIAISITALLYWGNGRAATPEPSKTTVPEGSPTMIRRLQVPMPSSSLSGTQPMMIVTDSTGHPISGAVIGNRASSNRQVYTTNDRGEAELIGVAAGIVDFRIICKGYIGIDSEIAISPQVAARITLLKFAKVAGVVTNGRGEPVQGASIKAEYEAEVDPNMRFIVAPDDNARMRRAAVSAVDGRFQIALVISNRKFALHASHPEFGSVTTPMQPLASEATATSDIMLPDATGLRGVAALGLKSDDPVTLRVWHVEPERGAAEKIRDLTVQAFEPFEIRDLPTGETLVLAMASDLRRLVLGVSQAVVEKGKMTDVGSLTPTSSIVRISCEMDPDLRSRRIELGVRVLKPIGRIYYVPCDIEISGEEASDFSIIGLPNGQSIVEAWVLVPNSAYFDSRYAKASKRFTHEGDSHVKLVIARKKPPTGLVVNLELPPGIAKENFSAFVWLESDNGAVDGYSRCMPGNTCFNFGFNNNLETEEIMTLRAVANGYTLTKSGIAIVPEHKETITVGGWSKGEPCGGQVVDEEGRPVTGATIAFSAPVFVSGRQFYTPLLQDVTTDTEGRFSVEALPRCKGLIVTASMGSAQSDPREFGAGPASGVVLRLKKKR